MESSEEAIMSKARYWAHSEVFDAETRAEIAGILERKEIQELTDRFYKDLSFGTGGMRGIMGAGSCRMNLYNIRKASTALALYLKDCYKDPGQELKVAIAWDSRKHSDTFARHSASVMAAHGIQVMTVREMRPVPLLSYMVRRFQCHAGICVTASHNPPEYNGFKVYWRTGGQLTPPHDKNIIAYYEAIQAYEGLEYLPWDRAVDQGLIHDVQDELDREYLKELSHLSLHPEGRDDFRIVYSPIHGTGVFAVPAALRSFGFEDIRIPREQEQPDGAFPTVRSPNPEDPEAMALALDLARKEKAHLVLATDPDADRIGCMTREDDDFVSFTGNQLVCLLTEYVLSSMKAKNQIPSNPLVISTIVTSPLLEEIAAYYGIPCDVTLTGFKWICQRINDYEEGRLGEAREFICGGEESYGFLRASFVRDKDAVSSCALAAEMVAWYRHQGLSLTQVLDGLYRRHHVYSDSLYNLVLPGKAGAEKCARIMAQFREQPPVSFGPYQASGMRDIAHDRMYDLANDGTWQLSEQKTGLPSSDVLQFYFGDHIRLSIRPSGTEPKIKLYFSVACKADEDVYPESLEKARSLADQTRAQLEQLVTDFIHKIP